MTIEALKERAAREAVREVQSGQVLGLGTGSTARYAVLAIAERLRAGELVDVIGIPTSEATRALALAQGIPLAPLEAHAVVDLAIDGADEVDPALDLIKGLGGALLREKAVEVRAKRFIVIADESKWVPRLGTKAPVPVEVGEARWRELLPELRALGCEPALRRTAGSDAPFITDGGNVIVDCRFAGGIPDPAALARALDRLGGVLAHGLFLGMATSVISAGAGGVRRIDRTPWTLS